jgi:hypothetical protein
MMSLRFPPTFIAGSPKGTTSHTLRSQALMRHLSHVTVFCFGLVLLITSHLGPRATEAAETTPANKPVLVLDPKTYKDEDAKIYRDSRAVTKNCSVILFNSEKKLQYIMVYPDKITFNTFFVLIYETPYSSTSVYSSSTY